MLGHDARNSYSRVFAVGLYPLASVPLELDGLPVECSVNDSDVDSLDAWSQLGDCADVQGCALANGPEFHPIGPTTTNRAEVGSRTVSRSELDQPFWFRCAADGASTVLSYPRTLEFSKERQ